MFFYAEMFFTENLIAATPERLKQLSARDNFEIESSKVLHTKLAALRIEYKELRTCLTIRRETLEQRPVRAWRMKMLQGLVSVCASESDTLLPLADQSMLLKSWLHKLPGSCRWGANELRLSACKYAADCFLFKHMTMHILKSISLASQRVSQASSWFIDANTISLCLQALYTVCIQCKKYLKRTLYFPFFLTHNCIWYSFSAHLGLQMYTNVYVWQLSAVHSGIRS